MLKKSNRLATTELKKIEKMPNFDHFPRPGKIDPYVARSCHRSYISKLETTTLHIVDGSLLNLNPSNIGFASFARQARAVVIAEMQHITYRSRQSLSSM